MKSVTLRRGITKIVAIVAGILAVAGCLSPPEIIVQLSAAERSLILANTTTLIATLGGLIAVTYFLTAQTRPMGIRMHGVGALYREVTFQLLLVTAVVALVSSLLGLLVTLPEPVLWRFCVLAVVGGVVTCLGVLPIALIQFENMDVASIAGKILQELSPESVAQYGLVRVTQGAGGERGVELMTNGLNYDRRDPLRAFHELVEQAVTERDRLLLGKLLGALFGRTAQILRICWPDESVPISDWDSRPTVSGKFRPVRNEELAVAIHALHYVVRLCRNLSLAWPDYDVARHSAQYQIAKLLACISARDGAHVVTMTAVSAQTRISILFRDVTPYGRVEPLNALAASVESLSRHRRVTEVAYLLTAIASISTMTKQLQGPRGEPLLELLSQEDLQRLSALRATVMDQGWRLTAARFDPWKELIPNPAAQA